MKLIRNFSFWLTLCAAIVVLYNIMGKDDKNLLFFFTSPPFWVVMYFDIRTSFSVLYVLNIVFWFLLGFGIDWGRTLLKKKPGF